jgi:hypothetical protein
VEADEVAAQEEEDGCGGEGESHDTPITRVTTINI